MNIKTDKELTSLDDIAERMASIARQAEKLENTETRSNHVDAFRAKHNKIAKLHARKDALHIRHAALIKSY